MKKIFFLDTNVLAHDPESILSFQDNQVIVPIFVIEELDRLKSRNDIVGLNSRKASRIIDSLREKHRLDDQVDLPNGGKFKIELNGYTTNTEASANIDNKILKVILNYSKKVDKPVILVTKDLNLRIKASAHGIEAQDYQKDKINMDNFYKGYSQQWIDSDAWDFLWKNKYIMDDILDFEPYPNQFVIFNNIVNQSQCVICRYEKHHKKLKMLPWTSQPIWGISPTNIEQRMALDLLLDDSVKIVTLVGKAGSGKTLLAILAGLQKVVDDEAYKKIIIMRPNLPFSRDIGFLPGNKEDKIEPWMKPIFDNIEFICSSTTNNYYGWEYLIDAKMLEMEALTYIRGRSLTNSFIIVDEAQGLTKSEVKTIITRVGKGSKIVFTGDPDPDQIDHPYLDTESSGLSILVHKIREYPFTGHILLRHSERSEVAELGTRL